MTVPPQGLVTFLFTDIEGSTTRWEQYPERMRVAVARHDALLSEIMGIHHGYVFKTVGDAFYVAFASARKALSAALAAQQALLAEPWSEELCPFQVRMALHSGEAEWRDHDYFGPPLNRVARILSTGHGGQILMSQATLTLVHDHLPEGATYQDLGKHRLKDLPHPVPIFQLTSEGLPVRFPPLKSLNLHHHNLPAQALPCVGREQDLATLHTILLRSDVRLISVTGPGGIGKTRLALHLAHSVLDHFSGGIWWVELADLHNTEALLPAVFQAIDPSEMTHQLTLEQLKDRLRGETLLILDSAEQVNDVRSFISMVLNLCPQLKMLVASRSALHMRQEYEHPLEPLAVPETRQKLPPEALLHFGAVALFVQQAQIAQAHFSLNRSNASIVVQICKRLDGFPLAIELAAAHLKILSVQQLLKRLSSQMPLLTQNKTNQMLHRVIEWSYNLLNAQEKEVLNQLVIFRGTFIFDAVETIGLLAEDIDLFDSLKSLINKSLVRQLAGVNDDLRFRLPYIIREYLTRRREEVSMGALQQRHACYYLAKVEEIAPLLTGFEQKGALAFLEEEKENIQTALAWYIEQGELTPGFRIAEAFWRFWWMNGHIQEGRKWLDTLLAAKQVEEVPLALRSRCFVIASRLASSQNEYEQAATLAEQALKLSLLSGEKEAMSAAYTTQAEVAFHKGAYEQAVLALEQSLAIQRKLGNLRNTASLLNNLGNVALHQGNLARAASLGEESLGLFRQVKDQWATASTLTSLGEVERRRGNHTRAKILYEEALKLCRALGYTEGMALALVSLGDIARSQENHPQASVWYKESLALFRETQNRVGITVCLQGLAEIAYTQEKLALATRLFAQAEVTAYAMETSVLQYEKDIHRTTLDQLRASLGYDSFEGFWTTGQAATLEQIMMEVLDEEENPPLFPKF